MTGWADLDAELGRWQAAGRVAGFWWRDDDAHRPGRALDRLLTTAARLGVPVALAVVPAWIGREAAAAIEASGQTVLQHGYAHDNRAPAGARRCEIVADRPLPYVLGDLAAGRARLEQLLGERVLPVLVPPWNRIDKAIVRLLPEVGYRALSRFGPRPAGATSPIREINAHVDIVDWKIGRGATHDPARARPFAGEGTVLAAAVAHLAARRAGSAADEPTGLLTHHLVHGDDAWAFVETFVSRVAAHPAARWLGAEALLAS